MLLLWVFCGCDGEKNAAETAGASPPDSAAHTDTATTDTADTDTDTAPVDADADGYLPPEDCDDADARVHPGAPDGCDALDQDCDGEAQPEGSCGEMVLMADGASGWWDGATPGASIWLLEASTDYTGNGVVDPLVRVACTPGYRCGGALAVLPDRIPAPDEDWTAPRPPYWAADPHTEYAYSAGDAGDFDGDGSRDLYLATLGCPPGPGALHVILGPSDRWGSGGRLVGEAADGRWEQHRPDDCFGTSASGGSDVDGDGRDDLLIETQGEIETSEYAALSFVAGRSPLPSAASMNDEVWFDDDVSLASFALLPDMDGDGAGEAAVTLTGAIGELRTVAYFPAEVLASGAAGASLAEALEPMPTDVYRGYALLRGRAGVGDVNGDGYADVAIAPWWATGGGEYQWCFAHLFGASDLRGATLDERLGGMACFDGVRGDYARSRVGGDLDRDGIPDVVYGTPDFGDVDYAACVVPSSRHPAAGWALPDEVRPYCFGSAENLGAAYGGVADLDGDELPELLGTESTWTDPSTPDDQRAGRILVMPGFEVPWDDASRW